MTTQNLVANKFAQEAENDYQAALGYFKSRYEQAASGSADAVRIYGALEKNYTYEKGLALDFSIHASSSENIHERVQPLKSIAKFLSDAGIKCELKPSTNRFDPNIMVYSLKVFPGQDIADCIVQYAMRGKAILSEGDFHYAKISRQVPEEELQISKVEGELKINELVPILRTGERAQRHPSPIHQPSHTKYDEIATSAISDNWPAILWFGQKYSVSPLEHLGKPEDGRFHDFVASILHGRQDNKAFFPILPAYNDSPSALAFCNESVASLTKHLATRGFGISGVFAIDSGENGARQAGIMVYLRAEKEKENPSLA